MPSVIDLTEDLPVKTRKRRVSADASAAVPDADAGASDALQPLKVKRKKKRRDLDSPPDASAPASQDGADGGAAEEPEDGELPAAAPAPADDGEHAAAREESKTRRTRRKERAEANGAADEPRRRRGKRSPSPVADDAADLFFIDVKPAPVPSTNGPTLSRPPAAGTGETSTDAPALFLPAHVSVLPSANGSSVPVKIIEETEVHSDDEEFIEYLDYDDRKVRVFNHATPVRETH
jgi:hypothetical protein